GDGKALIKAYLSGFAYDLLFDYQEYSSRKINRNKDENFEFDKLNTWKKEDFKRESARYLNQMLEPKTKLKQRPFVHGILYDLNAFENPGITNNYQAVLSNLYQKHNRKLNRNLNASAAELVLALSGKSTLPQLKTSFELYSAYRSTFSNPNLKSQLKFEYWNRIANINPSPMVDEAYQKLVEQVDIEASQTSALMKAMTLAVMFDKQANAISWKNLTEKEAILSLKQEKSELKKQALAQLEYIKIIAKQEELTKFGESILADAQVFEDAIKKPNFRLSGKDVIQSNTDFDFVFHSTNIEQLDLELFKLDAVEYQNTLKKIIYQHRDSILIKLERQSVWTEHFDVESDFDYVEDKRKIRLGGLDYGFYALAEKGNLKRFIFFQVSDIQFNKLKKTYFIRSSKDNSILKNAKLEIGLNSNKFKAFDDKGELKKSFSRESKSYCVWHKTDRLYLFEKNFYDYRYPNGFKESDDDVIMTDRAIYRPGQVVKMKLYSRLKIDPNKPDIIKPNKQVEVYLQDTGYKTIDRKTIKTNSFGTAFTEFVLPKGIPNGQFTLQTKHGRARIKVEEYKRPTFYVTLDADSNEKVIGDVIDIPLTATNYSGLALAGATLEYQIEYSSMPIYFWRCGYRSWSSSFVLDQKEVILDEKGKAKLRIKSETLPDYMKEKGVVRFNIRATVTDKSGNNETENMSFVLSQHGVQLNHQTPKVSTKQKGIELMASTQNFQNIPLKRTVSYSIWSLNVPKEVLKNDNITTDAQALVSQNANQKRLLGLHNEANRNYWTIDQLVQKGDLQSGEKTAIDLDQGVYKISYTCLDKNGKESEKSAFITIHDTKAKAKQILKIEKTYVEQNKMSLNVGETLEIQMVFPLNAYYDYGLSDFEGILKSGRIKGPKVLKLKLPITARSKGGIVTEISTVHQSKAIYLSKQTEVSWDKELRANWLKINKNIKPKAEEKWTLEVKTPKKCNETTEVLALMYDASLDDIVKHSIKRYLPHLPRNYQRRFQAQRFGSSFRSHFSSAKKHFYFSPPQMASARDNLRFSLSVYPRQIGRSLHSSALQAVEIKSAPQSRSSALQASNVEIYADSGDDFDEENITNAIPKSEPDEPSKTKQALRQNFKETVFFFPHLRSDADGKIDIPFKMTDGVGKFKLMLFGHTKDDETFYLEEDIQSQKDLMVEMHNSRFLYQGDELVWSAKVSNLTNEVQVVDVDLSFDQAQSKLHQTVDSKQVTIQPKSSEQVEWAVVLDEQFIGDVQFTVKAQSSDLMDIESRSLSVLSSTKRLNESFAYTLKAGETKQFKFSELFNGKTSELLKMELLSEPLWQAIKALPYVKSNNDQIFTELMDEYCSIELAKTLLVKFPELKTKLKQYAESLPKSQLKDKAELKSISLEESPWLAEAQNQEEEMRYLLKFFDENQLNARQNELKRKLTSGQQANGGFSWYKGGQTSYWMSLYLAKSLSRLHTFGAFPEELAKLNEKLILYLDREMNANYRRYKAEERLEKIGLSHLMYCDVRSNMMDKVSLKSDFEEGYQFFVENNLKQWKKAGFRTRIPLAKLAYKVDNTLVAEQIFKSIDESRQDNSEQATIFWKQLANGTSWRNRAYVLHSDLIDLYWKMNKNPEDIRKMQDWLIQQKRSQHWGSRSETAQLVSSLFLGRNQLNFSDGSALEVKLNGKIIQLDQQADWLTKTWEDKTKSWMASAELSVTNPYEHAVWFSAYQRYQSPISDIKQNKNVACTIEKELYLKTIVDNKERWQRIEEQDLKAGDEIKVKLLIESPQKMDFVYLQDYFPACLEPTEKLSGVKYSSTGSYYLNIKDQKIQFFMDRIARGKVNLEFKARVKHKGKFVTPHAEFQSFYAPEFSGHSSSLGWFEVED
ncbi:MAG: MG2 domain-containing protein, partial [Flavobacteriales bacterium]